MLQKLEAIDSNDGPTQALKNFMLNTNGGICPSDW